ncbi:hypothetical protein ES703_17875 [subsurface metagenome]
MDCDGSSLLGMALSCYLDELEESGMNLLVYSGGELVFSVDMDGIVHLMDAIDAIGGGAAS